MNLLRLTAATSDLSRSVRSPNPPCTHPACRRAAQKRRGSPVCVADPFNGIGEAVSGGTQVIRPAGSRGFQSKPFRVKGAICHTPKALSPGLSETQGSWSVLSLVRKPPLIALLDGIRRKASQLAAKAGWGGTHRRGETASHSQASLESSCRKIRRKLFS